MSLQNAGCQLERHDLTNHEWQMLGIVKSEFNLIGHEEREKARQG